MVMIILSILSIVVGIGSPVLIYYLQKTDEENQELKDIIQNVHQKVLLLKDSPIYSTASVEIKNILDYVDINTASTTVFNTSSSFIRNIRKRINKRMF